MTPTLTIKRYRPRFYYKHKKVDAEGSLIASLYMSYGIVEVLAYPGGQHGEAFTQLTTYQNDHVYTAKLPRCYHERWILRLARDFDWRCNRAARKDDQQNAQDHQTL